MNASSIVMNIHFGPILTALILLSFSGQAQAKPDTDEPQSDELETVSPPPVLTPPNERFVGIAYGLWHKSPDWGDSAWGTPSLGTYVSDDRAIIRQHATMLADADVDFVWLDWSNNINYVYDPANKRPDFDMIEDATFTVFDEFARMRAQGLKTPDISIFAGITLAPEAATDGRLQRKADQIWNQFVANPVYRPLMQQYEGKPLLVVYVNTPSPVLDGVPDWDDSRFTVRWMTGYITEQPTLRTPDLISKYGYWSWEDRGPQTFPIHNGHAEAMVINAATRPQSEPGDHDYIPASPRENGATFRRSWARAHELGPKFGMVVSWNEWNKGEQPSAEISKDVEPSKEFGDLYLKIMKEEIARFKTGE